MVIKRKDIILVIAVDLTQIVAIPAHIIVVRGTLSVVLLLVRLLHNARRLSHAKPTQHNVTAPQ